MMPTVAEQRRAQASLAWMLNELLAALDLFHQKPPKIIRRGFQDLALHPKAWRKVREKIVQAIGLIQSGNAIDWDHLEEVGLTDQLLDWKMDLFCRLLGRKQPTAVELNKTLQIAQPTKPPKYEKGKPWYKRVFRFGKSVFGSLMEAVQRDSRLRLILDAIKEFLEGIDAAVEFLDVGKGD